MPTRIGINGFGRMGRLALRAGAPSTMVVDGTCVKVFAWHDNEIGCVNRMIELTQKVSASL
jgi:glyceraldehyde-3-phosphate dehydrogenase/erythrose-4-phosphate dehydrogenase